MKQYRVALTWEVYGHVNVEADSLKEAIDYALGPGCPLPEGSYVDDSVRVDEAAMDWEVDDHDA